MKLLNKLLSGAAVAFALSLAGPATAQDCSRGSLDDRFCDVDGDLVADIPTDPADQVDPDTLIFTYTPVEDPAVYKEVWAGFMDHLSEKTGKEVVFFAVQNNAAQIEAM
ncbi:MAG: PhnD/SsuA/transferrin family substrate-binding protein, partial [Paracoccaceae bacterium]